MYIVENMAHILATTFYVLVIPTSPLNSEWSEVVGGGKEERPFENWKTLFNKVRVEKDRLSKEKSLKFCKYLKKMKNEAFLARREDAFCQLYGRTGGVGWEFLSSLSPFWKGWRWLRSLFRGARELLRLCGNVGLV